MPFTNHDPDFKVVYNESGMIDVDYYISQAYQLRANWFAETMNRVKQVLICRVHGLFTKVPQPNCQSPL